MRSRLLAVAAAVSIFVSAGSALAQQPSLADRETARAAMDEGDKKRDSGDLKGALKSYEAADAIMKVPTTALEVAKTQSSLNLLLEAKETLARLLRIPAKPGEPPPFVAARKQAETMSNDIAAKIPSLQINVLNADPAAPPTITIDNEPIPAAAAAAPRKVNPGPHAVVVKVGAYEKKQDITLAASETKTVTFDVKEKPAGGAADPGKGPAVEVDPSKEGSNAPKILMYGGFGLAIVGVGVGAVTGLMSISKTSELKDVCKNDKCPADKQAEIDSATGLGNISTIAFVAGGIGLGVGIVGVILSGGEKKKEEAAPQARTVRPAIGAGYLGLQGTF